jgi:hypothetical protein
MKSRKKHSERMSEELPNLKFDHSMLLNIAENENPMAIAAMETECVSDGFSTFKDK